MNAIIHFYGVSGKINKALNIFNKMRQNNFYNVSSIMHLIVMNYMDKQ